MTSLKFDDGYKEYSINGDESRVIRINTTDFAIFDRIKKAMKQIDKIAKEYENVTPKNDDEANDLFVSADKKVREQINYIFDSDVSTVAFGNTNCFSIVFSNKQPLFYNFLNAIIPTIRSDIEKVMSKSNKNVAKYTSQLK